MAHGEKALLSLSSIYTILNNTFESLLQKLKDTTQATNTNGTWKGLCSFGGVSGNIGKLFCGLLSYSG